MKSAFFIGGQYDRANAAYPGRPVFARSIMHEFNNQSPASAHMGTRITKLQQFVTISGSDSGRRHDHVKRARSLSRMLVGAVSCTEYDSSDTSLLGFAWPDDSSDPISHGDTSPILFATGSPIQTAGGDFDASALLAAARSPETLASALCDYDGQFALLAWNGNASPPMLATDPLGQFHVYVAQMDEFVLYSTSSLLLAGLTKSNFDDTSVREFISRGNCFSDRTLFSRVRKVPGGSVIPLDANTKRVPCRYWRLADALPQHASTGTSVEHVGEELSACITALRAQYSRPIFDLTGGFDSRIIYGATFGHASSGPVSTTVAGPANSSDVQCATRIAAQFGSPHHIVSPMSSTAGWWQAAKDCLKFTDGEYDLLEYAGIHAVQSQMREQFGLSVNGSGGGLLQGYWWELLKSDLGQTGNFPFDTLASRRLAPVARGDALLRHVFDQSLAEHFRDLAVEADQPARTLPNTARMDHLLLTMRVQRWQGRIGSATSRYQDVVSPFLLRPVLATVLHVPPRQRDRGKACRQLLHALDPALARLPLAGGMPATPVNAMNWPVHAITGGRAALRRILARARPNQTVAARARRIHALLAHSEVQENLDMNQMRTSDLYNGERLIGVIRNAREGNAWAATQLGRVLTLEHTARTLEREARYTPAARF